MKPPLPSGTEAIPALSDKRKGSRSATSALYFHGKSQHWVTASPKSRMNPREPYRPHTVNATPLH